MMMVVLSANGSSHPVDDHRRHGHARDQRRAEVATQDLPDPQQELHGDRLVEPHVHADLLQLLAGRAVAGDDRGRIAGREAQDREDDQGDHSHHREGRRQPSRDVREHRNAYGAFLTFQNTATGASSTPVSFVL